jgi:hypothetical protein
VGALVRALTQTAFVDEDDRAAFFLGFFLMAGQVLRFHSTMASSLRSSARPAGRCGLLSFAINVSDHAATRS